LNSFISSSTYISAISLELPSTLMTKTTCTQTAMHE